MPQFEDIFLLNLYLSPRLFAPQSMHHLKKYYEINLSRLYYNGGEAIFIKKDDAILYL